MLQATPTIAGLKAENPDAKVTVLVEKQFEDVCRFIPHIDEVQSLDLATMVREIAREGEGIIEAFDRLTEFVNPLREAKFDYSLNMSSSAYTALLLNLLGIDRRGGWAADSEGNRVIESDWARLFATSVFHQNRQYNSLNLVDVFRCSADVDEHPRQLLIKVEKDATEYCEKFIRDAGFTNTGPIISIQAGASQAKRQWAPSNFVRLINVLINKFNARVILTGSKKELDIINPIHAGCNSPNVAVIAGKTTIPQLAALLHLSDILVTGDTGPMHMSVAAGTPVVALFLASAFGFETGPYSEGNLVLQPVIGCGPCNPNKPCARPDCHDHVSPEALAELVGLRLAGDVRSIPPGLLDPSKVIVYRSSFDKFGFCDLVPLNSNGDSYTPFRNAYRHMWLDDLGDFEVEGRPNGALHVLKNGGEPLEGLSDIVASAEKGAHLISELSSLIRDPYAAPKKLGEVNEEISATDVKIENLGFRHQHFEPVTRMFVFAKENLSGTDPLELASQMGRIYSDLKRRCEKFQFYFNRQ